MNIDRRLTRRDFLLTAGATAAGTTLFSLDISGDRSPTQLSSAALAIKPVVDPDSLEKPDLKIGYVPVNDCAPFAIAWKKGFFRKYGLNVRLNREASWATSRDGLIFGRLDAAPVVSGAVTNARTGAEGAKYAPLCAAMTIHRHGNALTMNRAMWDAGLRPWHEYNGNLEAFRQDFHRYFASIPSEQRVLAVVLSSAIYEYFVRYLIAAVGINPLTEFRIVIVPPPQMVANMRIGAMQAYMVAEPWNSRAIRGNEGIGFTFLQGREIWRGHPDRVLAVHESFIKNYPKTYRSLVKAMIEACRYCSQPQHREEVAQLIAERSFTGAKPELTRPGIEGIYDYGGFDHRQRIVVKPEETTIFFDLPADLAAATGSIEGNHSTFLWQSQSLWLMSQSVRWGQLPEIPKDAEKIASQSWRTDLYREIAAELEIPCPKEDYKIEPAELFIDNQPFDPSDLTGYVKRFEIRANQPQAIYLS
ncbi:MAG: ABC transporter substrate-binding protein [Aphanocapsa sp. GSE-SYN-MK-11-07L]|jgi:nitrate/nitrite transport system substrate-binding protein|nr:ABC transporter substrate-binding protein [Aphanocapsa sp. GSE-SYN-MK-11-07L]